MLPRITDSYISSMPAAGLARTLRYIKRPLIDLYKYEAFRRIVRYAYKRSAFYRRKFDELGIDVRRVKRPSDLKDFYTTSLDIIDNAEEFLCRRPHIVFESSGTTGRNKRIYLTQDELTRIGKFNAAGMFIAGLSRKDRLVNAFDFNIWIPGMLTHKGFEQGEFFNLSAGKVDPIEVYKRIPIYDINVIFGEPTWLIKLTEIAEKNGSYPLKLLVGGAEEMPKAARPWMERVWQGAKVRMVYGSVESSGIIGFEAFEECGAYHIDEINFFVEIAQPDKDGYGEVIYTTLGRKTMPLIRYNNRDTSKLMEEKCACGLPFRKLAKLRGRTDEMIVASGGNLYPLMFQEILKDAGGVTSDWQIIFKLRGIKEIMEFNLELCEGFDRGSVEKNIFSSISSRYPDLWKNYQLGIFEIAFTYHKPLTLRADNRKLLRIVDKRYKE